MERYKPITLQPHQPQQLPEFALQKELREDPGHDYQPSASFWYWTMLDGKPFDVSTKAKMLIAQKKETPYLVSALMERACNLSCSHCLYQDEKSSRATSREGRLAEVIEHMVKSLPPTSEMRPVNKFMSIGRILRAWHLDVLARLHEIRPDVKLGIIDNGTYTKLLPKWPADLKLDWIDISIDGTEASHNTQRGASHTYRDAMNGLRHAREVVKAPSEGGYVASLFTLTKLNARDTGAVADTVFAEHEGHPLVDKLNFTTMSPTNAVNRAIEIDTSDFAAAWEGIKAACAKWNTPGNERISLGIYRIQDIEKFAAIVGERTFLDALTADEHDPFKVQFRGNFIEMHLDGVPLSYLPVSIWPPEELLIEADAAYRVAYEAQFTLDELHLGKSKDGQDTRAFTVAQLTPATDLQQVYEKAVDHYWQHFGSGRLDEECAAFARIRAKAGK